MSTMQHIGQCSDVLFGRCKTSVTTTLQNIVKQLQYHFYSCVKISFIREPWKSVKKIQNQMLMNWKASKMKWSKIDPSCATRNSETELSITLRDPFS